MSCDAPWPEEIHAHLSAFSEPWMSVQPPAGNWSVMVSAYSWPNTIVKPSATPALPELTKFSPQLDPMSSWYGSFAKASPPYGELTPTSPVQSCQAHQL